MGRGNFNKWQIWEFLWRSSKINFSSNYRKQVFRFEIGSELESNWQGILINFHSDMGNIFKNALLGFGM